MRSAGFRITLSLQTALAAELRRGTEASEAAIVIASYPDCVNVLLERLKLRVTCGIVGRPTESDDATVATLGVPLLG